MIRDFEVLLPLWLGEPQDGFFVLYYTLWAISLVLPLGCSSYYVVRRCKLKATLCLIGGIGLASGLALFHVFVNAWLWVEMGKAFQGQAAPMW